MFCLPSGAKKGYQLMTIIIICKFVKLFLFVTLYRKIFQIGPKRVSDLSHVLVKTVITKNVVNIQTISAFSFQNCQEGIGPLLIESQF